MATDTTYQLSVQAWFAETPGAAHDTSAAFKGVLRILVSHISVRCATSGRLSGGCGYVLEVGGTQRAGRR